MLSDARSPPVWSPLASSGVDHDTGARRLIDEAIECGPDARFRDPHVGVVEQLKTFADEDHCLPSRQLAGPLDNEVERSERAGGGHGGAKFFDFGEVVRVRDRQRRRRSPGRTTAAERRPLVQGHERLHAVARLSIPAKSIDHRMQHAAIRRERLKPASGAARAHDRDEIGRAQLAVDERVQRLLHVVEALERQPEIVDDDGDCPLNLLPSDHRVGHCRRRGHVGSCRLGGDHRRRAACDRHELGECHRLNLAVLPHFEIGGSQIWNGAAISVGDHRVDADNVDAHSKFGALGAALCWRRRRLSAVNDAAR